MKQVTFLMQAIITALFLFSTTAFASGGYGRGSISSPQKAVDQNYEAGKAIYRGRADGIPKLDYCVKGEGESLLPLKRKNLSVYKQTSYNDFAQALYNCDQPERQIADELERDDFLYVLYYLNKRYKLKLRGG